MVSVAAGPRWLDAADTSRTGYDPELPKLKDDPRLNPGKGLGVNWHPSQPTP